MVAHGDAAERPVDRSGLALPARAFPMQAESTAESGILRWRAIVCAPGEDARVLGGRDRAARERRVGVVSRRVVDGDEAVEAILMGRAGDDVAPFGCSVIAPRSLRADRLAAEGDLHHDGAPGVAAGYQPPLALAHLDVSDARAGRIVGERDRGVEVRRRIGGGRLGREGDAAGEQRGRERQQRCDARSGALALAVCLLSIRATAAPPTDGSDLDVYAALRAPLGSVQTDFVEPEDTLLDVAARHRLGFEAVARLNPGLDPWIPPPGSVVRLPTLYLVPEAAPVGIVVNIPEMRLYDFGVEGGPEVLAVAIGDAEDATPVGEFRVGSKRIDPAWRVPASIRAVKPELPPVVAPGPDNPLGSRWLTIGNSSYGLHGTNVRWSIGRIATHGCVRLYEEDIVRLYDRVREGTRLQLVYQPYKWGRDGDRLLLEAHPDVYARISNPLAAALDTPRVLGLGARVDIVAVQRVIDRADGVPTPVGKLPPRDPEPGALLRNPLLEDRLGLPGRVFSSLRRAARVGRSLLGSGGAALGVLGRGLDACHALVERVEPAIDLVDVAVGRAAREPQQQHGSHAG